MIDPNRLNASRQTLKIMKTVHISVFAIGVALSVAPIFNSAYAQSNNDSARVLLELQSLRTEIAELRDMIERQQFELKKLKRVAAQSQPAAGAGNSYQQPFSNSPTNQQSQPGPGTVPSADYYNNQANIPGGQVSAGQVSGGQVFTDQSAVASGTGVQGVNNQGVINQTGSYQAPDYQGVPNAQAGNVLSNDVLSNGVAVVDRPITAPSQPTSGAASGPEIVERGIDSTGNSAQPSVDPRQSTIVGGQSGSRPVLAVPNAAQGQQNGWGVINANRAPSNPTQQPLGGSAPSRQTQQVGSPSTAAAQFSEDQYYDRGFDFLKQSKYDEAVTVFEQQIAQYPQGDLADDAHYWIAEAMFISRKSAEAKPHLRAIIDNHPQSARLPDAMLKTAYIEQDLGNLIEARILLQEIVAKHPSSNAAIAAKNRLANLKSGG